MTSHSNESALNPIGGFFLLEPLHPRYLGWMFLSECHESPTPPLYLLGTPTTAYKLRTYMTMEWNRSYVLSASNWPRNQRYPCHHVWRFWGKFCLEWSQLALDHFSKHCVNPSRTPSPIYGHIHKLYGLHKSYSPHFKIKVTFGHMLRYEIKVTFGEIYLKLCQMNWNVAINNVNVVVDELPS